MTLPTQPGSPVPRTPATTRRRPRTAVMLTLIATFTAGTFLGLPAARSALLGSAAPATATAADPVRAVQVITVGRARTVIERSVTGSVVARYETPIGFRVGGKILSRAVEVGQFVRAGDPLFTLDPSDYRAAVAAAEATLLATRAQALQTAADERRHAQLVTQGWTARSAYDRYKALADAAANQASAAAERVTLARNDLSYAALMAPHDGIVTALKAETGQVVAIGQPVLTLVRPGDREALVTIPESHIADIRTWTARASFWGHAGEPEPAALREIAPQADPVTRTYAVRFSLSASADNAALGSTITIHLSRPLEVASVRIPASAVWFRNGNPLVWRLDATGEHVQPAPVSIERLGTETADVGGLADGNRIVTLGVHRLDEGTRVRPIEGQAAAQVQGDGARR